MSLQVTDIWRYPVKSCRGEQLGEAVVEPWGLAGDRRWMAVDDAGRFLTAREHRRLALLEPRLDEPASITLSAPDQPDLTVAVPAGEDLVPVSVWSSDLPAA